MNQNVLFKRGTSVAFLAEYPHNNDTIYFLRDTGEIYLGGDLIADRSSALKLVTSGDGDVVTAISLDAANQTLSVTLGNAGDAESVRAAIEEIRSAALTNIKANSLSGDPTNSSLVVTRNGSEADIALKFADPAHTGSNVQFGECSEGLFANVEVPEANVQSVAANDKILALRAGELSTTLSITAVKKNGSTYVQLLGINSELIAEFDAADFVKDGMLDKVELKYSSDGQNRRILVFTFNTAAGKDVIEIDLQELIDVYVGKGSIKVTGNEIEINNSVTPVTAADPDLAPNFGEEVTLYTVRYNSEGLVTGRDAFKFRIPQLGINPRGVVGAQSEDAATLVTWASMDATGALTGSSVDLIKELNATTAHDTAVPTARATFNAIQEAVPTWGKIQ